jgi:hypothetical protein
VDPSFEVILRDGALGSRENFTEQLFLLIAPVPIKTVSGRLSLLAFWSQFPTIQAGKVVVAECIS